jgi:hypothetical protein
MSQSEDMWDEIESFRDSIARQKREWVDSNVVPYLRELLNKAQSRLRRPIKFLSGCGTHLFFLGDDASSRLEYNFMEGICFQTEQTGESRIATAIRKRFPELVEFYSIVLEVQDSVGEIIGDISPGIEPRTRGLNRKVLL